MILYSEGATQAQENEAEAILFVLTDIYPGHPWAVRVYPGGFFIRHLAFPNNWGMNCKYRDFAHDAAVLKREIIMMAGEWLERAALKRGVGLGRCLWKGWESFQSYVWSAIVAHNLKMLTATVTACT